MAKEYKNYNEYVSNEELDEEVVKILSNNTRNTRLFMVPLMHQNLVKLNPINTLAVLMRTRVISANYDDFRARLPVVFSSIIPSYQDIRDAKQICYPANVRVTSDKYHAPIEELAGHTTMRILEANQEKIYGILSNLVSLVDTVYAEMSMTVHIMDCQNSLMGVYISPEKMEYKGNDIDGTDLPQKTILWENKSPNPELSRRPHLLEFAELSKDYVLETKKNVEEKVKKLSQEIHCFMFHDKNMIRVSYSFEFSNTFDELLADGVKFSTGELNEMERLLKLQEFSRELLEYSDPMVLSLRFDSLIQQFLNS